jgi:hypothetical protein
MQRLYAAAGAQVERGAHGRAYGQLRQGGAGTPDAQDMVRPEAALAPVQA